MSPKIKINRFINDGQIALPKHNNKVPKLIILLLYFKFLSIILMFGNNSLLL